MGDVTLFTTDSSSATPPSFVVVELSQMDLGLSALGAVVASCTWFAGNSTRAKDHLQRRLLEMIVLNPWLQGRLTRKAAPRRLSCFSRKQLHLVYEEKSTLTSTEGLFTVHDDASIDESIPYAANYQCFEPYIVPGGEDAVDAEGAPLYRVALVRISQASYAIVESLNHAVGDGSTFYELRKMLSVAAVPRGLIIQRHPTFLKDAVAATGGDIATSFMAFYPTMVRNLMKGSICTATVQPISAAWLEEGKSSALELSADVKFLSSNDVIMSFLGRRAHVTFFAKNMRRCVGRVTAEHAGNYSALLPLLPSDCASPSIIRRSVSSVPLRRVSYKRPLPGPFSLGTFALPRFTQPLAVTNWSSLYEDLVMPAAEMLRHQPIINGLSKLARGGSGTFRLAFDAVKIYRPRSGELAMLYLGSHLGMTPSKLAALASRRL